MTKRAIPFLFIVAVAAAQLGCSWIQGGILGPTSPLGHVESAAWDETMAVKHLDLRYDPDRTRTE